MVSATTPNLTFADARLRAARMPASGPAATAPHQGFSAPQSSLHPRKAQDQLHPIGHVVRRDRSAHLRHVGPIAEDMLERIFEYGVSGCR